MHEVNGFRMRELQSFGTEEESFKEGSPLAIALADTKKRISGAFENQPAIKVTVTVRGAKSSRTKRKAKA